jgi:methylmalonyl-CoA mutase N-terminal domain/subunit
MKKKANQGQLQPRRSKSVQWEPTDETAVTSSGQKVEPHYGPELPGNFPFTRGPYRTMYRQKIWTMRQYSGFGSAKETNERFRYLLKAGQSGLSCAFDLPTQMGYDSDHMMAEGEVGRVGVAISHVDDMDLLLKGLPLGELSTSMTINATGATLLALYSAVADSRKIPLTALRGTIQNDILKEYVARGTYIYPPEFSLKLVADTFRFANEKMPKWNPISISGYHIREAGSTAAQEVAFTLANTFTYVQAALDAGLKLEDFVPRLSFFFNVHNHFFEEIAKFRVARKIYAEEMRRRFDCPEKLLALRFHAQTAGSTLTAQQPINNAIRVAYQAMAAVLGGAQSLHTNSFDEALSLPTEESALLALRTQQVLAAETGVTQSVDPLYGSYLLQDLGEKLETEIMSLLQRIDDLGGMLKAIETGTVQREIQNAAFQAQKKIDEGDLKVVGVNCLQQDEKPPKNLHQLNEKVVRDQLKRLKIFKSKRSSKKVEAALRHLQGQVQELHLGESAEVCEAIALALKAKCTLGEVADVMREVAGTYQG